MRRFAGRFGTVIGTERRAPEPPPGCVYVPIEITSDDSVRQGLTAIGEHHGKRVASVIHLAAYYDFLGAPSSKYEEITVQGTRRLLTGLQDLGFEVEQFVFSSTMLVHRPASPGQFIAEDWPLEPTWAYPQSKVRTEQMIEAQRGGIPAVLLRISGVYDDGGHSIPITQQMQRIYERQLTSRLYSAATSHGQSFLHMDDLVEAIALTVERRAELPPSVPILLGEPGALSYDELQHVLWRLIHGKDRETYVVPAPLAKVGAWFLDRLPGPTFIKPWMIDRAGDHYALDVTRARTLLGWEPSRSLRETMPVLVAGLQADPVGWYRENDLRPLSRLRKSLAERHARRPVEVA
jgi:nucleoside-diphosphate-sugar epimerase